MADPYLSEIRIFSFGFAPRGWLQCNGQLLAINQNQALFALIGTFYGGNGTTTFALPNLQGNVPVHMGTSPVGTSYVLGQRAGEASHTLSINELPAHTHTLMGNSAAGTLATPAGNSPGLTAADAYATAPPTVSMHPLAVTGVGQSQPHNNLAPYLVLNFCIAVAGIFPTRN